LTLWKEEEGGDNNIEDLWTKLYPLSLICLLITLQKI
jgi:hypothetical protein